MGSGAVAVIGRSLFVGVIALAELRASAIGGHRRGCHACLDLPRRRRSMRRSDFDIEHALERDELDTAGRRLIYPGSRSATAV